MSLERVSVGGNLGEQVLAVTVLSFSHRYELGAALFIGWAGASLCIIGGVIFCFSISDNNKTPR